MDRVAAELHVQITATLAESITPEPWDASDEIGVVWWVLHLPTGTTITGFVGIGIVFFELIDGIVHAGWTIADAQGSGADERRAWIKSAIRAALGPDAIHLDAGRVTRQRGAA